MDDRLTKLLVTADLTDFESEKKSMACYLLQKRNVEVSKTEFLQTLQSLEEISKVRDLILPPYQKYGASVLPEFSNRKDFLDDCFENAMDFCDSQKYSLTRELISDTWDSAYVGFGRVPTDYYDRTSMGMFWDFSNCELPQGVNLDNLIPTLLAYLESYGYKLLEETDVDMMVYYEVTLVPPYGHAEIQQMKPRQRMAEYEKFGFTTYYAPKELPDDTDNGDKAMVAGIVDWAHRYLDKNHEPTTVLIISGDVDMLSAIRAIKKLGFKVMLAVDGPLATVLRDSVSDVLDWKSMATYKKV